MSVTVEFASPEEEAAVQARAEAEGLSVAEWLRKLARENSGQSEAPRKPLKTGRGMWAKYGPAPSAEEIDANRAEMFRGFGEGAN